MPRIYITIKSFEWYHIKNTVFFLKKIQFILHFVRKTKHKFKNKIFNKNFDFYVSQPGLCSNVKQNSKLQNFPQKLKILNEINCVKKQKLFTVLRSPHIDKKSREQFKFISYKKKLFINLKNFNKLALFFFFLKNSEFPGVEIEISLCYTSLFKYN